MLSGHWRVDAGALPDDETVYTSTDELYDHSAAVHVPKPSPVSLPIGSGVKSSSVSIHARSARGNNAGSGGCPNGGRREETQTDSSQVGRWRTWFSNAKQGDRSKSARRRGLPCGLEKEARRLLQKHHTADGHHHQAVSENRTRNEVTVRGHLRHDHHGHGPTTRESRQRTRATRWVHLRCGHGED